MAQAMQPDDMTDMPERRQRVLAVLDEGRCNPMLIRERTGFGKGEVNTDLLALIRSGYVRRLVPGLYELTDEGRDLLDEMEVDDE